MLPFDEYRSYDAIGLAALVAKGDVTPQELLDSAIARMQDINPLLNAVTQSHEALARGAIREGLAQGPFTGVPFLLKDAGAQLAGTSTRYGSRLFANAIAEADSTLVERYKRAGLVIFGKTNTPELGLSASTESTVSGSTSNPWDLQRTAGGSSGGAGASVSAGIVPAAHGSDGGGSIRIPASCCGLFGLKPTRARTPSGPWDGESWGGLGVMHALTRSVRDSAALLDATHGPAPGDPYSAPPVGVSFLSQVGADPGRLRVGLQRKPLYGTPVDSACEAAMDDAAALLCGLGHGVDEIVLPGNPEQLRGAFWTLVATSVSVNLRHRAALLRRRLIEDDVEPVTWRAVLHSDTLTASDYANARATLQQHGRVMARLHERFDVVVSPTLGQAPVLLGPMHMANADLDAYRTASTQFAPFCNPFNMSGAPSMSVPLYWTDTQLPVGVMFSADVGREDLLFRLAGQLETVRPWFNRVPSLTS